MQVRGVFKANSAVRSYLMVEHQVTKIIRLDDRYDFTKGLYLNSIFTINSVYIKPQNDKSSLNRVLNRQISIIDRALPASACPFYGRHAARVVGISVTGVL